MARTTTPHGPRRNTAPAWKKLSVVLSAPVAMLLVDRAAARRHLERVSSSSSCSSRSPSLAVWGMAKALGVHLSLGSWD